MDVVLGRSIGRFQLILTLDVELDRYFIFSYNQNNICVIMGCQRMPRTCYSLKVFGGLAMGRLSVRWNGDTAGYLYSEKNDRLRFSYSDSWLAQGFPPISLSLPTTRKFHPPLVSTNFFKNLQLEGSALLQAADGFSTSFFAPPFMFRYFKDFGLDCAGALSIGPEGLDDSRPVDSYRDVTDDLHTLLEIPVPRRPTLVKGLKARLSIAGVQDKLPLVVDGGRFYLPTRDSNSPTTFILKGASRIVDFVPENEYFCTDLARRVSLPVPETSIIEINGEYLFLSKRYDRLDTGSGVTRLHQEDFCQAFGLSPKQKYEDDRGPGFAKCMKLIIDGIPSDNAKFRFNFIKAAFFNLIIGNCDAHAKNFSILYTFPAGGRSLAPFYDLMSTAVYPFFDKSYAMSYGRKKTIIDFDYEALKRFSVDMKTDTETVSRILAEVADGILKNIDLSYRAAFPINPKAAAFIDTLRSLISEAAVRIPQAAARP